jgi:hypothetical protein
MHELIRNVNVSLEAGVTQAAETINIKTFLSLIFIAHSW